MQAQSLAVALVGQLLENVAAVGRVHDVVVALLRVPHGEAVVVTCGEADVARSGSLEGAHPRFGIEAVGIEGVGGLGILRAVQVLVRQIPLALGKQAVDAPMQEDAEFAVGKRLPCLQVLGRGLVAGGGVGGGLCVQAAEAQTHRQHEGGCFHSVFINVKEKLRQRHWLLNNK